MRRPWSRHTPVLVKAEIGTTGAKAFFAGRLREPHHDGSPVLMTGPMAMDLLLEGGEVMSVVAGNRGNGTVSCYWVQSNGWSRPGSGSAIQREGCSTRFYTRFLICRDAERIVEDIERLPPIWPQHLLIIERISRAQQRFQNMGVMVEW